MPIPRTILFIPFERQLGGTIHRGTNMIAMLRRRYSVLGVDHRRNFGSGSLPIRFLRMLWYWLRTVAYGLQRRKSIDLVFCENVHVALGTLLAKVLGKPCIWDIEMEDVLYLRAWRRSLLFKGLVLSFHGLARKGTDALLVPSDEDRESYVRRGYRASERIIAIPLALDFSHLPRDDDSEKEQLRRSLNLDPRKRVLIYTGQRIELPYREGAEWICRELAPALESAGESVQILLTGGGGVGACVSPQIIFTGFVPNIFDYIRSADVCLAPIWQEVGVPGKVFEYMALGKPAVVTSKVRGLRHLTDGWDVMVATTPEDFVRKVIYLIQHPKEAIQMGMRARETAQRYHSHEAAAPKLWRVVDETVARYHGEESSGRGIR